MKSSVVRSVAFCAVAFVGCKPSSSGEDRTEADSAPLPPSSSSSSPGMEASAPGGAHAIETWSGTYTSEPGSLYVVDGGEWAGVTWRGDDSGDGLGEGRLTLAVTHATHEAHGTADGAIGDVVITGALVDETLTASIARKDPMDRGLTGTATGKLGGDSIKGSMRLAVANARVLREVHFTLFRVESPSASATPPRP